MKKIIHSPAPWYPIQIAGYMGLFDEDFYSGKRLLDFEEVGPDIAQSNCIIASKAPDMYKIIFKIYSHYEEFESKEEYNLKHNINLTSFEKIIFGEVRILLHNIEELKNHKIT